MRLMLDGLKEMDKKKLMVGEEQIRVTGTLSEPGFLRCEVEYSLGAKTDGLCGGWV
jgi:hypothetical protein